MTSAAAALVFLIVGRVPAAMGEPPSFMGLGLAPVGQAGTQSWATGVSADGAVVVGSFYTPQGPFAFRWSRAGGMTHMGLPPSGYSLAAPVGVSADGSVVAGNMHPAFGSEPFRWTDQTGYSALGHLPGGNDTTATALSADGLTVIGYGNSARVGLGYEGFRWTLAGGMVALGGMPGGSSYSSRLFAVSADGGVAVGLAYPGSQQRAVRWTPESGFGSLGVLPIAGHWKSSATGVSADGSVVVGISSAYQNCCGYPDTTQAFRWTAATGMVGLGNLPGHTTIYSPVVSPDGAMVFGVANGTYESFVWDSSHGIRTLRSFLEIEHGLSTTGWTSLSVSAASADGRTIVGTGGNPLGQSEGWVAFLGTGAAPPCYVNCDGSTAGPVLNVNDFICFQTRFAAAQAMPLPQQVADYANCDGSTVPPVLNIVDFVCFQNKFAAGCP